MPKLFICTGCDTITTNPDEQLETIRQVAGVISCCPERKFMENPNLMTERDIKTLWQLAPGTRDDVSGNWRSPALPFRRQLARRLWPRSTAL